MAHDYETFITLYQSASDQVKALIDGETIGEQVDQLIQNYGLKPEIKPVLISTIADSILDDDLTTLDALGGTNLSSSQLHELAKYIDAFVSKELTQKKASVPRTPPQGVGVTSQYEASHEITDLEHTIQQLPKMRTMAVDMQSSQDKEVTQATSQEDLLNRK